MIDIYAIPCYACNACVLVERIANRCNKAAAKILLRNKHKNGKPIAELGLACQLFSGRHTESATKSFFSKLAGQIEIMVASSLFTTVIMSHTGVGQGWDTMGQNWSRGISKTALKTMYSVIYTKYSLFSLCLTWDTECDPGKILLNKFTLEYVCNNDQSFEGRSIAADMNQMAN